MSINNIDEAIGNIESDNNPEAKNPYSSASGRFQMTRPTFDGLKKNYPELPQVTFDEFQKNAQELFKKEITDKQFYDLVRSLYPKPEDEKKASVKKWENKVILLDDLYHNSNTNANIKGTAWGALNAFTERLDYFRTARKGNSESLAAGASGFDPVLTAEKNKIKKAILELTA